MRSRNLVSLVFLSSSMLVLALAEQACKSREFNASPGARARGASHAPGGEPGPRAACGRQGDTFMLCGGVPHTFVACDGQNISPGQPNCLPPGTANGRYVIMSLGPDGQPDPEKPYPDEPVVRTFQELMGLAKDDKEEPDERGRRRGFVRSCGEAFDAVMGGRGAYALSNEESKEADLHGLKCRMEMNTRLGGQTSVSIIPRVGEAPEGLPEWKAPSMGPMMPVQASQSSNTSSPLVARDPAAADYGIPTGSPPIDGVSPEGKALLYAMLDARRALTPTDTPKLDQYTAQIEGCLKNSRARGNLDLQQHFYCILPKDPYRACLGGRIAAYRLEPACKGLQPNVVEAIEHCFQVSDLTTFEGKPATFFKEPGKEWRLKAFKDAFVAKAGARDFDVLAENAIINEYYARVNPEGRPRRVVDTWPKWTPDQPRYVDIRALQRAGVEVTSPSEPSPSPAALAGEGVCTTPPTGTVASDD